MKKLSIFLMMVIAIFFCCSVSFAEEEITQVISGYQTGEFAYKSSIEKSGNEIIAEIKKISKDGAGVIVRIKGSADTIGKSVDNDELSRKRAEAVAGEFRYQLPNAKVNVVPEGDSQNVREVHVAFYQVATKAALPVADNAKQAPKKADQTTIVFISAILLVAVTSLWVLICKRAKKRIVIDLEIQGKKYKYYPEMTPDGRMESLHQNEAGNFISFTDPVDLCRSIKATFKKQPEFFDRLIEEGRLVLVESES